MKYLYTLLVSLLIIIAVLIPGPHLPDVNIVGFDKVVHIGMFGAWAMAVYYDFSIRSTRHLWAMVAGLAFSVFTEIVQIFIEGRTFDWSDMVADAIGLILGLTIGAWMLRKLFRLKD